MSWPLTNDPSAPALGAMFVADGSIESYEEAARHSRVADSPVPGMILHWAARTQAGMLTGSLWRQYRFGEQFMSKVLADVLTELVGPGSAQPSADYSYALLPLAGFASGVDTEHASGRRLGQAGGAVLVRHVAALDERAYREASTTLGLVDDAPAGMVSHVAARGDDGIHWIDTWLDRAAPRGFYERAGIDPAALETDPLHTLVVNRQELAQVPKIPSRR